jgi:hypothetical protein
MWGGEGVEKAIKMLAVSIFVGCMLISAVLFYNNYASLKQDRYYFSRVTDGPPMIFDKVTGKFYYGSNLFMSSRRFYSVDLINQTVGEN